MSESINTSEISVIVQGAVDKKNTPLCIKSIRKYLPGAEVILSTWKGTNTEGLDYDSLILNDDPGGRRVGKKIDNVNRQIVSTKNGVAAANRKYVLKVRSDVELRNCGFLRKWESKSNRSQHRENGYILFENKIIASVLFCKKCLSQNTLIPTPFHLSDWFQFGLRGDLELLWNTDCVDYERYWDYYDVNKNLKLLGSWEKNRYVPESYIFYECVKKDILKLYMKAYMIIIQEILFSRRRYLEIILS